MSATPAGVCVCRSHLNLYELRPSRRAGLDGHCCFPASEFLRDQLQEFVIRFAVNRRCLQPSNPTTVGRSCELRCAGSRLHLHLKDHGQTVIGCLTLGFTCRAP
jgi:hypothetical protein